MIEMDLFSYALELFFFFVVYSFFGWIIENTYSLVTTRQFFKEGFLWGPFKPMYGLAPILLVVTTKDLHQAYVIMLCFLIPTAIEYVSGYGLQTLFHRRWWDYSQHRWQLHGHICLSFSICWVFLSLACLYWVHPMMVSFYKLTASFWPYASVLVALYFLIDLQLTIKRLRPQEASTAKATDTSLT